MTDTNIKINGTLISVKGDLDAELATAIVGAMNKDNIFTLDFSDVESIKFAALRTLLNCRKSGQRFCVINASDNVAERFEDTGVSVFINVCRKPKPLSIKDFEESGGGFMSTTYNSGDGDSMIKVYGQRVPKWMVAQEKTVARAVLVFGLPTPMVGTLYEDGDKTAVDFERIEGKRSFSRIISEQPERLVEMSTRFAQMCRKLHSTSCDTTIFSDRSIFYRQAISRCSTISEEVKKRTMDFINSIPTATTCLHGDMQPSNIITNEKEDLWIDLADFGYGYPMLDLGMWYFLAKVIPEANCIDIFHFNKEQMDKVWDIFMKVYFDTEDKAVLEAKEAEIKKFGALHIMYLGSTYGFEPFMMTFLDSNPL